MPNDRPHLEPGPDHPITILPTNEHVTVSVNGVSVADSRRALELAESSYPPVLYLPVEDVREGVLQTSDRHTYCPYKGEASYYDLVPDGGAPMPAAVWYYPAPYRSVADIAGHVAFYADRVEIQRHP
jgi:uncharacterized protein (DUF427 family)